MFDWLDMVRVGGEKNRRDGRGGIRQNYVLISPASGYISMLESCGRLVVGLDVASVLRKNTLLESRSRLDSTRPDSTMSDDFEVAVYFQSSWAILSTIGIGNVLFGMTVVGITSLSPISLIPIVTSASGAVANGLCYYYNFGGYPLPNSAAASAVADVLWMVCLPRLASLSISLLAETVAYRSKRLASPSTVTPSSFVSYVAAIAPSLPSCSGSSWSSSSSSECAS